MRIRNRSSRLALRRARLALLWSEAWLASQPAAAVIALQHKLDGNRSRVAKARLPRDFSSSVYGSHMAARPDGLPWAATTFAHHIIDMRVRGEITFEEQQQWIAETRGFFKPAPPTNLYA